MVRDIESTFQRVVKIDPFDVTANRELAAITFAKCVLFKRMNKIIVFIYCIITIKFIWLFENLKLINTQFSGNHKRAYELLSKAIEVVHDEKELSLGQLVRERLVATIAMERSVQTNAVLGLILQRIYNV